MLNKLMRIIDENSLEWDAVAALHCMQPEETVQNQARKYFQRTHSSPPALKVEAVSQEQINEQMLHDFYRGLW